MVEVTYRCPHCGALADLEREGHLADKAVTPYPLEGWSYARPDEDYEEYDGIRFVCGREGPNVAFRSARDGDDGTGCGEPFYLSFVRFEAGREVEPERPSEYVELAPEGPRTPRGPSGPRGPGER